MEGLRLAREGGYERVVVKMDNESAIKIMTRDRELEEGANTLIRDYMQLIEGWHSISFMHTCREGNKCADYFANLGQHGGWEIFHLIEPPNGLNELLQANVS